MAHAITLTDGTTTANLYSMTGTFPTTWQLGAPEEDQDTIGEALDLLIQATSIANLQTAVRQIEMLIDSAVRREKTRVGPRVFLTVQWDGESDAWRSEVVAGRLEVTGAAEQYSRLKLEATLGLTRRAWWEGPETQIPLTNGNGTNDTAGLTVWNHDDTGTGHDNYVQIASTAITGVLPAPVKIELKNTAGSARTWDAFYFSTNALGGVTTFTHILEAEARTAGGTIVADANSSGGSQVRLTNYVSGQFMDWTLSAGLVQAAAGRWVRLILSRNLRNGSIAQAETVQAVLMDSSGSASLWVGPEVALTPRGSIVYFPLIDIGALPLPPGVYDAAWGALKLRLIFRITSGTATTYLDFIQLMPMDSYRVLDVRPIAVPNNSYVVDNGYDGIAYVETSGAKLPYVLPRGEPLCVWPGKLQRVYILASYVSSVIEETWDVRMWYRPRRLSI